MSDQLAPKADGLKYTEKREVVPGTLQGSGPVKRSIRKKGFCRALKRRESWAVWQDALQKAARNMWQPLMNDACMHSSRFVGIYEALTGTRTIPIIYPESKK